MQRRIIFKKKNFHATQNFNAQYWQNSSKIFFSIFFTLLHLRKSSTSYSWPLHKLSEVKTNYWLKSDANLVIMVFCALLIR